MALIQVTTALLMMIGGAFNPLHAEVLTESKPLTMYYPEAPGWIRLGQGQARVATNARGERELQLLFQGQIVNSVNLDQNVLGAFAPVLSVELINYLDYELRARDVFFALPLAKPRRELQYKKPIVVLRESGRLNIFSVDERGELVRAYFTPLSAGAKIRSLHVGIKDPSGILNFIRREVLRIDRPGGFSYYSPEENHSFNKDDIRVTFDGPPSRSSSDPTPTPGLWGRASTCALRLLGNR